MSECVFCERIQRGQLDLRFDETAAFEPLNPVTPGHMLFMPAGHVEHSEAAAAVDTGWAVTRAAEWARRQGGDFNLITSSGRSATQTIPHVHIHYVPRRPGDGLALPWAVETAEEAHDDDQ